MQQNFEKQVVSNVSQENVSKMGLSGLALHPAPLPPSAVHPFSHMFQARVVAPAWPLRVLLCVPPSPLPGLVPLLSLSPFLRCCTFSDLRLSLPISLCQVAPSTANPWKVSLLRPPVDWLCKVVQGLEDTWPLSCCKEQSVIPMVPLHKFKT